MEKPYQILLSPPRPYPKGGGWELTATVTVRETGNQFEYVARNIEDFGLAINPVPGGGLAIDVESFMAYNTASFPTEAKKAEYRASHPTPTGWGWDRTYATDAQKWVAMTQEEIDVYRVVVAAVSKVK